MHYDKQREQWDVEPSCEINATPSWLDYRAELEERQLMEEYEKANIDLQQFWEEDVEDLINHPRHYNSYPDVEVIDITKHMNFCRGNIVKYVARAAFKGTELQDLEKALWYLNTEIARIKND